jgi:hypothetical protein
VLFFIDLANILVNALSVLLDLVSLI